jgi:hypothetical protein
VRSTLPRRTVTSAASSRTSSTTLAGASPYSSCALALCDDVPGLTVVLARPVCHSGAPLAQVVFRDPYRYKLHKETFIATEGLTTGSFVYAGKKASLNIGNVLPLAQCPEGTVVCNVEERVGDRGAMARTSGNYATVIGHSIDENKTRLRLPSGAKKTVSGSARATIGVVAGGGRVDKPLLKAGRAYFKFKAKRNSWPRTRGVAMNPVDHPHGGGNHQRASRGRAAGVAAFAPHPRLSDLPSPSPTHRTHRCPSYRSHPRYYEAGLGWLNTRHVLHDSMTPKTSPDRSRK